MIDFKLFYYSTILIFWPPQSWGSTGEAQDAGLLAFKPTGASGESRRAVRKVVAQGSTAAHFDRGGGDLHRHPPILGRKCILAFPVRRAAL
jgi:hypothetical protein